MSEAHVSEGAGTANYAVVRTRPSTLAMRWGGRIASGPAVAFLFFDSAIKVLQMAPAIEATTQLGYPAASVMGLGIVQLVCLLIYTLPRTSVLGAILLTGHLGGAIASQVRVGAPTFNLVFPLIIGALLWGGLFLRNHRLRGLLLHS
jgi:ABC-type uncharacterized transport system permease subunit